MALHVVSGLSRIESDSPARGAMCRDLWAGGAPLRPFGLVLHVSYRESLPCFLLPRGKYERGHV